MHKHLSRILAVSLIVAVPAAASAQVRRDRDLPQPTEGTRWGIGAGLTLPLGNYSTGDNIGFHGMGLVQLPLRNSPVHLRFDVMFSTTSHKNGVSGSTRLIGADADALYHLGDRAAAVRPYILGGLGLYNAHASGPGGSVSQTAVAFNLGGGILFGMGKNSHAFVEARYLSVQTGSTVGGSFALIPITFGLTFSGNR